MEEFSQWAFEFRVCGSGISGAGFGGTVWCVQTESTPFGRFGGRGSTVRGSADRVVED